MQRNNSADARPGDATRRRQPPSRRTPPRRQMRSPLWGILAVLCVLVTIRVAQTVAAGRVVTSHPVASSLAVAISTRVLPHSGGAQATSVPTQISPSITPTPTATALGGSTVAPGACLAFAPTQGNQHITIYIDPGHGGIDPGTTGTSSGGTVLEKDLTLGVGRQLLPLLRSQGYRVVMSRMTDTLVGNIPPAAISNGELTLAGEHLDTTARITCANRAQAKVLVAIHFNSFSDPTVGGMQTFYDSARPFSAANQRLATLMQQNVLATLQQHGWSISDRGITDDSNSGTPAYSSQAATYGHLLELGPAAANWLAQPSAMPGVITELLFISRPAEADIAASLTGQRAIAEGLDHAIRAFFAPPAPPVVLGDAQFSLFTVNPMFMQQRVAFTLSTPAHLVVQILPAGQAQPIRTLDMGEQPAGMMHLIWNGRSDRGTPVPSGSYSYVINATAPSGMQASRMYNDLGITYKRIVVSLSRQSLTAYDGNTPFLTSLVTTGNKALPTPLGTFPVLGKYHPFTMISPWPKSSPFYYAPTPIQYALLFDDRGYYVHDASWRWNFGPGSNVTPGTPGGSTTGSHGCVNVPLNKEAALYNWATIGTIVDVVP